MMQPVNAVPVLLTAIILICAASTTEDGVASLTERNSEEETDRFDFNPLIELLRGQNGVVYTRWGRTTCPNTTGTELVYAGRAGGSRHNAQGGAANHLCLPENPDYLEYTAGVQSYSPVYGVEYQALGGPLASVDAHDMPCTVCFASARETVLMIPAKTQCPSTWTLEYTGYLMTERVHANHRRSMFECVDKVPESVPGSSAVVFPALLTHTEAVCNSLPCPPYDPEKELTCAVCTK